VLLELGRCRERGAVDALQHLVAFAAQPVRAGDVGQLERADVAGGRDVRAAAQVEEVSVLVIGDLGAVRNLRQEVQLVGFARCREALLRLVARGLLVLERLACGHDLAHARFDPLEILGSERLVAREVVIEAVFDRRAAGHLHVGEQLGHGGG